MIAVFFVLMLLNGAAASSTTTNKEGHSTSSDLLLREEVVIDSITQLQNARVHHVRQILVKRLDAVCSGERSRQFEKWVKKKGDLQIISMHGVDVAELDFTNKTAVEVSLEVEQLFPEDERDLSLVPVADFPNQYPGKPLHLLEERPASVLDLVFRSIRLGFNFAPVTSTAWLAFISSTFREKVWFQWVASCLAASGPAFIKWAQWASTRVDMFPEALCVSLSQLHNDAPIHSWGYTEKVMESSLGLPKGTLLEVFDAFDPKPLASGSIAQVHEAVLNGARVAAKVRHPNVSKLIDMDFRLMGIAATIADWIPAFSWLHIRDSVDQFSHTMAAQAHLNVEGHHLEVLNYNFRKWKQVGFPKPFFASSAAIIETFEPGKIVTSILDMYDAIASRTALAQGTLTVEEVDGESDNEANEQHLGYQIVPIDIAKFIVTTGLSLYLKMLLVDQLMHADLHPGNILLDLMGGVNPDFDSSSVALALIPADQSADRESIKRISVSTLGITLVDAGMVAKLSPDESTNFIGLLCALGDGNGKVAGRCALQFSKESLLTEDEENAFINDMDELFRERCRGYGTNVDVGHVLRGVLGLIRKHRVRIDANYATLVVNCLCVESLAKRTCPTYNLLDAAKPLLKSFQGLCYNKKDGTLNTNPSRLQKGWFHLCLPFAYFKKRQSDTAFFAREKRRARIREKYSAQKRLQRRL